MIEHVRILIFSICLITCMSSCEVSSGPLQTSNDEGGASVGNGTTPETTPENEKLREELFQLIEDSESMPAPKAVFELPIVAGWSKPERRALPDDGFSVAHPIHQDHQGCKQ